jgi:hypothetical protein
MNGQASLDAFIGVKDLDLRVLGPLKEEDENFICKLIVSSCRDSPKWKIAMRCKNELGWDNGCLVKFELAGLVSGKSVRGMGYISSGEWLCGILTSGSILKWDHLSLHMKFINRRCGINEEYKSGKDTWTEASKTLRTILDLLDDAVLNQRNVTVACPTATPINENQTLDEINSMILETGSVDVAKNLLHISWD